MELNGYEHSRFNKIILFPLSYVIFYNEVLTGSVKLGEGNCNARERGKGENSLFSPASIPVNDDRLSHVLVTTNLHKYPDVVT